MENRFENAKLYLIELLRAYGHRHIVVKMRENREMVEVMALTFVKHQLTCVGISFPYSETKQRTSKIINYNIDDIELCIVFHKAVFELETAYIEEFCQSDPQKEEFVDSVHAWIEYKQEWLQSTFPYYDGEEIKPFLEVNPEPELEKGDLTIGLTVNEEDVKTLSIMGYQQISSVYAMMQLFWTFCLWRIPINRSMKKAILSITVNEEAADYLLSYHQFYNRFLKDKLEHNDFLNYKKDMKELKKKHRNELMELKKEYQKELMELKKKYQETLAELKRQQNQGDLKGKLQEYKAKVKKYKHIVKGVHDKIANPFSKIYDLTNEDDIMDYISWFRMMGKKIKNQNIKSIVKHRFENESDAELFKSLVEEYNASLIEDVAEEEEEVTTDLS